MNFALLFGASQLWILIVALGLRYAPSQKYSAPNIWIFALITALAPLILAPFFINTAIVENVVASVVVSVNQTALPQTTKPYLPAIETVNIAYGAMMFWGYCLIAACFVMRRIWQWWVLQNLPLKPTNIAQVFTSDDMPPLALSWPRRCVVLPTDTQALSPDEAGLIIAHERAHLAHFDPEFTLGLLILQDILWFNPAVKWLVSEWRCAAEIRADRFAIGEASLEVRQAYAALLLAAIGKNGAEARPCPSAYLTSKRVRSVKMRLSEIMTTKAETGKGVKRRLIGWLGTAICVSVGTLGLSAAASPVPTPDVKPLKRYPPVMPSSCRGASINVNNALERGLIGHGPNADRASHIKALEANRDKIGPIHVGRVTVKFDVTKDGRTKNSEIIKASEDCFIAPSLSSIEKWEYPVTSSGYKGVEAQIIYRVMINQESPKSVWEQLIDFHSGKFD